MDKASTNKVIDEIRKRTGIEVHEDDPAFLLVSMNQIMLEGEVSKLTNQLKEATKEFESAQIDSTNVLINSANQATGIFQRKIGDLESLVKNIRIPSPNEAPPQLHQHSGQTQAQVTLEKLMVVGIFASGTIIGAILSGAAFMVFGK